MTDEINPSGDLDPEAQAEVEDLENEKIGRAHV